MEESSNQSGNSHCENVLDEEGENEGNGEVEPEPEPCEGLNHVLDFGGGTPSHGIVCRSNGCNGVVPPPSVGMVFPTWEDADMYYRRYGKQEGFGVVRASGAYKQQGGRNTKERRNYCWTCECYGKTDYRRRVNGKRIAIKGEAIALTSRKTKKCNCPALMYASLNKEEEWEVKRVVVEHKNHTLTPGQDEVQTHVKKKLLNDHASGVKPQIHSSLARDRNGLENMRITHMDLHNVIDQGRRLKLMDGDANAMQELFNKMTADNQNFFHMHRFDQFGVLKDVMWVDARSRVAFEEFGDIVWFDSTYLINEYELPFVTFVGVNHHGQSILLGCALISHEDVETFQWLFSTWLLCMGGKAPVGILTDENVEMRKALSLVMPQSRHRWCLWHILHKFGKKLGVYERYQNIKEVLYNTIYDSLTPKEFEDNWTSAMKEFGLECNDWLAGLYREREMWIPVYVKQFFWAGMKTTHRVGNINSFFDGYLKKHTQLSEFAPQYCSAMESRANNEKEADTNTRRYVRQLVTEFPVECVFQKLYTDAKFKEVQLECTKVLYINGVEKKVVSDHVMEHTLEDRVWTLCKSTRNEVVTKKRCTYKVMFNSNCNEAWCDCKLFECHGIMCRHLIKIFDIYDITEVPEMYILSRWRKDILRKHTRVKVAYHDPSKTEEVQRYNKMMAAFESICLKASAFEDNVNIVMELIHLMDIRLDEINVMARRPKTVDLITPTPSYVGNKRLPNINAPHSVSKGLGNCTKRKEVSPPAEQESCTHGISSSSSPHVKDPIVRKKAHSAFEPSTDVAMVDQPLIGSPTSNMLVDNGQVGSSHHNTVGGEAD